MTVAPYFHIGIQVNDIDKAMEEFSALFHVGFYPPIPIQDLVTDSGIPIHRRATYSQGEPPYLELLEAVPESGPPLPEGMNHVGLFSAELSLRVDDGFGLGIRAERRFLDDQGDLRIVMTEPNSFHGTRLEIFDESHRENTTPEKMAAQWLAALSRLGQSLPS